MVPKPVRRVREDFVHGFVIQHRRFVEDGIPIQPAAVAGSALICGTKRVIFDGVVGIA